MGDLELAVLYGRVIVLDWTVTAPEALPPAPANNLPLTMAPLFTVMETAARIFPLKTLVVPKVAELPTCQKMFFAWAPPLKTMLVAGSVVSVEAILKMKTAFALPWPSRVKIPWGPVPEIPVE